MANSNDNLKVTMTVGQKNEYSDFINLHLWASKGAFKVTNKTFNFSNKITVPDGATGGTISQFSEISADGTTPSGDTNAPCDMKLSEVTRQIIEVECLVAGTLTVIIES